MCTLVTGSFQSRGCGLCKRAEGRGVQCERKLGAFVELRVGRLSSATDLDHWRGQVSPVTATVAEALTRQAVHTDSGSLRAIAITASGTLTRRWAGGSYHERRECACTPLTKRHTAIAINTRIFRSECIATSLRGGLLLPWQAATRHRQRRSGLSGQLRILIPRRPKAGASAYVHVHRAGTEHSVEACGRSARASARRHRHRASL